MICQRFPNYRVGKSSSYVFIYGGTKNPMNRSD
jgi:hypothetical protein